jgi:hypothetical protein
MVPSRLESLRSILSREIALVIAHDEDELLPNVCGDGAELPKVKVGGSGEERVQHLESREAQQARHLDHPDLVDLPGFEAAVQ